MILVKWHMKYKYSLSARKYPECFGRLQETGESQFTDRRLLKKVSGPSSCRLKLCPRLAFPPSSLVGQGPLLYSYGFSSIIALSVTLPSDSDVITFLYGPTNVCQHLQLLFDKGQISLQFPSW